ncbi:MAG: 2'-deoxycytidine 5'-triphosphate deaminase [Planctomycetes bacterium]|nr:2'-deoxycytidine 5'-triphosphate deaminase [Planctomycetota bacterium]
MTPPPPPGGQLLVDRELEALLGTALRAAPGAQAPTRAQISPASVDLRLSGVAWRIRAGFLPAATSVESRLAELALGKLSLEGEGAVLERGCAYLVALEEELALPADLRGRFNPRSSTGRCDIFTRVLCEGHARFDEAPPGYRGRLWIEIAPLSFPVRLKRGDRLAQLRLARGNAALSAHELRALHASTPLCFDASGTRALAADEVPIDEEGGLALCVGLAGRDPAGWRAGAHTDVVEFAREGAHAVHDFWEPVHARNGRSILEPGSFYIFASRERLRVPPEYAAEMLPVDVGIGELRNNYAGFFDNGFGWREGAGEARLGTPAVLEVRAHDVPFLVEDGQVFCRLRFFRTGGRPQRVYGEGRAQSYQDQDLTLARCFRRGDEP